MAAVPAFTCEEAEKVLLFRRLPVRRKFAGTLGQMCVPDNGGTDAKVRQMVRLVGFDVCYVW